jgi:hypothetical protein
MLGGSDQPGFGVLFCTRPSSPRRPPKIDGQGDEAGLVDRQSIGLSRSLLACLHGDKKPLEMRLLIRASVTRGTRASLAGGHHPPCKVEMNVTRSPSATHVSSVPLQAATSRTRSASCQREQRAAPMQGCRCRGAQPAAALEATGRRKRRLCIACQAHLNSQSSSFSRTSTPGLLQGAWRVAEGAGRWAGEGGGGWGSAARRRHLLIARHI